jgi:putative pyruvate formate lyase activating enzyme
LTDAEWNERIAAADALSSPCMLCPRVCGVNRFANETGYCRAQSDMRISSAFPHHGEEPPISGIHGSGTVFFSYCSLRCCFCQNYQISQQETGDAFTPTALADKMLDLQNQKVHNVNMVTATHFLPWVLRALKEASAKGLSIPVVWNSSGYERVDALDCLNSVVDIFLPDMKYGDNVSAGRYCDAPDYVEENRAALRKMFRMAGTLKIDKSGIAVRGLCIRHLVLPGDVSHTKKALSFLADTFDPADITISLMAQYRPMYHASKYPELCRLISDKEYADAQNICEEMGFNVFYQELLKLDEKFCIDFEKRKDEALTGE